VKLGVRQRGRVNKAPVWLVLFILLCMILVDAQPFGDWPWSSTMELGLLELDLGSLANELGVLEIDLLYYGAHLLEIGSREWLRGPWSHNLVLGARSQKSGV